jgi:ubiquinone/menaquinone biosynthesis C-methylase UbiE
MNMPKPDLYDYIFSDTEISQDAAVLDVGCYNSKALCYMKDRYKLSGTLIGIDKNAKHFEDSAAQLAEGIRLVEMNASEKLDFPDNAFDFIFHKDALECFPDISGHISELCRVLKPNGQIVCVHRDWETVVCNGSNKKLINKAIYGYANFLQANWMDACDGWMGRRLFGLFNKTKMFESSIDCYNDIGTEFIPETRGYGYINSMNSFIGPTGFLTQEEYDELITDVAASYDNGMYLFSAPFYIYKGTKIA